MADVKRVTLAIKDHWISSSIAALLGVAAAVVTLLALFPTSDGDDAGQPPRPTAQSARPTAQSADDGQGEADGGAGAAPAGTPEPASSSRAHAVGDCLDAELEATNCRDAHHYEVMALGEGCSTGIALGYLGGEAGRDVLLSELPVREVADACVLDASDSSAGAARDSLLSREGDRWRRCLDELGMEAPCADRHLREVIYVGDDGRPEAASCSERADAYLGTPVANKLPDLMVEEAGSACLLAVRGRNVLTASLRRLGSSSLPVASG